MSDPPLPRGREVTVDAAIYPSPGSVIEVVKGEVLVFVELPAGRRLPLTSRRSGEVIVGCHPRAWIREHSYWNLGTSPAQPRLPPVYSIVAPGLLRSITSLAISATLVAVRPSPRL